MYLAESGPPDDVHVAGGGSLALFLNITHESDGARNRRQWRWRSSEQLLRGITERVDQFQLAPEAEMGVLHRVMFSAAYTGRRFNDDLHLGLGLGDWRRVVAVGQGIGLGAAGTAQEFAGAGRHQFSAGLAVSHARCSETGR